MNENNEGNEADDGRHENESNNVQVGHVNTPNEDVIVTNTLLCVFVLLWSQNAMLMKLLKLQQTNKSSNDIKITPDLNKSIPVFYGLSTEAHAQDWLRTVNSVANFHR